VGRTLDRWVASSSVVTVSSRDCDSPAKLLTKPGGVFRGLMEEAGRWVAWPSVLDCRFAKFDSPAKLGRSWQAGRKLTLGGTCYLFTADLSLSCRLVS
jgi:hypothetical protein